MSIGKGIPIQLKAAAELELRRRERDDAGACKWCESIKKELTTSGYGYPANVGPEIHSRCPRNTLLTIEWV